MLYRMIFCLLIATSGFSAEYYVSGKVTSLMGSAFSPAIRVGANLVPTGCDGGTYGWLYFKGTAEQKQHTYATALAMALSGHTVTVYTNNNGTTCEIGNIQITSGLN